MGGFLLRRVGAALIVLLLASMLVFLGIRALPGDPATALGAENRDPEVMKAIRHHYGLDQPIPVQYVKWLSLAVQGDLGSDQRELPVAHTIVERLPTTLELAFLAVLVGVVIGIPAGIIAAVRQRKASDYVATTGALVGLSVPHFWLGLMMISLFAVNLHWLPASGYVPFTEDPIANLQHMIMPAIVLGTGLSAVLMRQMRSSMLNSLGADYVRTARAKGLTRRQALFKHGLRTALIPMATLFAYSFGLLLVGATFVEKIFGWHGMGEWLVDSVTRNDINAVAAVTCFAAVMILLAGLAADIAYAILDPRIRVS